LSKSDPLIGFISPPDWYDPSPLEFLKLCGETVRVQQYTMCMPDLDWTLEEIARSECVQLEGAIALAATGCDVIALVGTPFGWAGLQTVEESIARRQRLTDAAGVPVVTASMAIVEALQYLGARHVGLACTYYSNDWKNGWSDFIRAAGFEVTARNFIDDGDMPEEPVASTDFSNPDANQIRSSVLALKARQPKLEAIAISGAGARTLSLVKPLMEEASIPVIGSDTALYWAIASRLGLPAQLGCLRV
jgi:maleate cis-trans isomerase